MAREINLGELGSFEEISSVSVAASRMLADTYEKLGKPEDPFSKAGEKMVHLIIRTWEEMYPEQRKDWLETKKEYQKSEMSTMEQVVNKTGRSLASIPTPVYKMMRKVFPDFKMDSREDFMKLVKKYPYFQMANKR